MNPTSPRALRHRIASVQRVLLVLLLVAAALISPTTSGIARADGSDDPPALISVDDAKSAGLKAQIASYDQSVAAQQRVEQALLTEKASLEALVAKVNAALTADDAAGAATDQLFAEHNSAVQAYNNAGPPGDPAYAAELDAEGQQLAAQQAQNNAKVRADNADRARGLAAMVAHNKKGDAYYNTNKQLTTERATLMAQILAEQAAADLAIIATLTTVDSLSGMDSPQPSQENVTGGDNTAPATLSSCSHSFAAGTQVMMAAGTTEPIQDVHVGDLVENAQPGGGNEVHEVDQVHVTTTDTDFTRLTVSTPAGPEAITGTQNHPYYDQSIGAFVNAANLKPGDRLQSINAGVNVTVLSVVDYVGRMVTYDLTIDGLHTYYVVAGDTPVLVHNANCWSATEDILDNIHDTYGPRVLQGVEWMMDRYNQGATGHALNGIGPDAEATARYLARPRTWSHIDSTSGNWVTYDSSSQILIIRTAQDVHAYNYTRQQWATNVGVRYVDPAAGVTPPAWP